MRGLALLLLVPASALACADAAQVDEAIGLATASHPVLAAGRATLAEQVRQRDWRVTVSTGYSATTTFESGESGPNAAIRVQIPLFDRTHALRQAKARAAFSQEEHTVLSALLTDLATLCEQADRARGLQILAQLQRDRLRYRQERVEAGLDEAETLWQASERVQRATQEAERAARGVAARRVILARQYGGAQWRRLQALLAAMAR